MADSVQKTKKAAKPKKASTHPKYSEMIRAAITSLKERGGSSRLAVLRYILSHYDVGKDEKAVNTHLKLALKSGVRKGALKQAKGTGASGSFRIGTASAEKPKRAKKAKKPKAAKPKKPKAAKSPAKKKAKKPAAKKAKSPAKKKPAAKKAPVKKAPAKKPKSPKKKAAAKPKAAKSKAKSKTKKTVKK